MKERTNRRRRSVAALLAASLLLVACSGVDRATDEPDKKAAVLAALQAMVEPRPSTITMGFANVPASDLVDLSVGIRPEWAEVLAATKITIRNDYADNPLEAHFVLKVDVAGAVIEGRQLEHRFSLRADTLDLLDTFDAKTKPFIRSVLAVLQA